MGGEHMNSEETLSREEIADRIVTGMGMVYDLFNEMNSFFRSMLDALEASDLDILTLKNRFILPKPKKRSLRTAADDYLKTDMGFIAELGAAGIEDEEVSEEDEERELEIEKKGVLIKPDTQFVAVRAILYNHEQAKTGAFDPAVVGVILSSFTRSLKKKTEGKIKKETNFRIKKKGSLLRSMGQLDSALEKKATISWRIPKYTLTADVTGIVKRPLVNFDTEENFKKFVEELIAEAETG